MTNAEFEAIDAELIAHSNKVLLNRKDAYAVEGDRLDNFKATARATGLTPEKVCETYLHKALSSMVKILHGAPAIGESLMDRFSDPLNYVRLAYALVKEKEARIETFRLPETMQSVSGAARDPLGCYVIPLNRGRGRAQQAANRVID